MPGIEDLGIWFFLGIFLGTVVVPACANRAETPAKPNFRWLKGNLHTHSLWSDGDGFPEVAVKWYRSNGYDFLSLTEHNVIARKQAWLPVDQA